MIKSEMELIVGKASPFACEQIVRAVHPFCNLVSDPDLPAGRTWVVFTPDYLLPTAAMNPFPVGGRDRYQAWMLAALCLAEKNPEPFRRAFFMIEMAEHVDRLPEIDEVFGSGTGSDDA